MLLNYEVKVATEEDAEAVGALLRASYPTLMAPSYDDTVLAPALELMTKANQSLLGSGTYYVAALSTGRLVGCGGWTLERPGAGTVEPGVGHVRHFAVHPHWARRGIGRAIFSSCERSALAAGVRSFECYSSLNAEQFYGALAFKRIREMDIRLSPHVALRAVLMRREL